MKNEIINKKFIVGVLFAIFIAGIAVFILLNNANDNTQAVESYKAELTMYKSPNCGCCDLYKDELEKLGYKVNVVKDRQLTLKKEELGIPKDKESCHSIVLPDGRVSEGHVPLDVFEKFVSDKGVYGITLPGMPIGSPGMPGPKTETFRIYSFDKGGNSKLYAEK